MSTALVQVFQVNHQNTTQLPKPKISQKNK